MEAGARPISIGPGKEDWGKRDDHRKLGKGEDQANQGIPKEIRENLR